MRLLLTFVLLVSHHVTSLHGNETTAGVEYRLDCVNDYLFTITCSLTFTPEAPHRHQSFWLDAESFDGMKYVCVLVRDGSQYCCSFTTLHGPPDAEKDFYPETFFDSETFSITLYHNRSDGYIPLLENEYMPVNHIKPNAPCNLTVSWSSNQYHFSWLSCYEKYLPGFYLIHSLKYQLCYHRRGQDNKVRVQTTRMNISVSADHFDPDTEYLARVRSSPDQLYKGQWSEWGSAILLRTDDITHATPRPIQDKSLSERQVIILLCVLTPVLLLLCYIPVIKLSRKRLIPTPAPYFQSLYSDCHGDFRSWVVTTGNKDDLLQTEDNTLHIDSLTEATAVQDPDITSQPHHQVIQEGPGCDLANPACDASLLGFPYAVTPAPQAPTPPPPPAPRDPLKSLSLSSEPEGTLEGDSGCWLCSVASLERASPWYNNDYCTLADALIVGTFGKNDEAAAGDRFSGSSFCEVMSDGDY